MFRNIKMSLFSYKFAGYSVLLGLLVLLGIFVNERLTTLSNGSGGGGGLFSKSHTGEDGSISQNKFVHVANYNGTHLTRNEELLKSEAGEEEEEDFPSTLDEIDADRVLECYTVIKDGLVVVEKNWDKFSRPAKEPKAHRWDPRFAPLKFLSGLTDSMQSPILLTADRARYSELDRERLPYFAYFRRNALVRSVGENLTEVEEVALDSPSLKIFREIVSPPRRRNRKLRSSFRSLLKEFALTYGSNYTDGKVGLILVKMDDVRARRDIVAMAIDLTDRPIGVDKLVVTPLFLPIGDRDEEKSQGGSQNVEFVHPKTLFQQYFGNGPSILGDRNRLGGALFDFTIISPWAGLQSLGMGLVDGMLGYQRLDLVANPLDTDADLILLKQLWCFTKPGGLVLVSIPHFPQAEPGKGLTFSEGAGLIVWASHRVYGLERMYRLMENWLVKDILTLTPPNGAGHGANQLLDLWVLQKP